jgi:flagellar hook-associated protein 2
MTTTSSVTSTPPTPTVNTGNAQDVSTLNPGSITVSLNEAVNSKVQPYLDQATAVQTQITANQTKLAAYQNMQSLLQALQSAAANLSTQALEGSNVFNNRTANLSASSTVPGQSPSSPSALLSASVANGTAIGSHTVTVNQLASPESDISQTLSLGSTDALSNLSGFPASGSFTIAETGKSPVAINITNSMSLSQVAAAINGASSQTGVTASVVSVSSTQSVLVVTGMDTATPLQFTDGSGILASLGVGPTLTGGTAESDTSAALGLSGSFTVNGGGTVTVNAGMSLTDIQTAINGAAGSTGAVASITPGGNLQVTSGGGNAVAFGAVTGNVLSSLGMPAGQVTVPQAAKLTVDGVSGITRTTNTISDVLTGVTLNLTGADPNTQVTLNVAADSSAATSAVQALATAYNNWQAFVHQNEATNSDGSAASGATLFSDASLREASLAVDSAITTQVRGLALSNIGISLDSNNNMQVDRTQLSQALATNFTGVFNMFQSQVTTDQTYLRPLGTDYSSYNGPAFSLGLDASGQPTLNGTVDTTDFTVSGSTISGNAGTPYAGMAFTFTGTPGQSANVTATMGLANQVFSAAGQYGNPLTGSVQNLVDSLQTEDTGLNRQYTTLTSEAQNYTNFLLAQYSSMSSRIAQANQIYLTLQSIINAQTAKQ